MLYRARVSKAFSNEAQAHFHRNKHTLRDSPSEYDKYFRSYGSKFPEDLDRSFLCRQVQPLEENGYILQKTLLNMGSRKLLNGERLQQD